MPASPSPACERRWKHSTSEDDHGSELGPTSSAPAGFERRARLTMVGQSPGGLIEWTIAKPREEKSLVRPDCSVSRSDGDAVATTASAPSASSRLTSSAVAGTPTSERISATSSNRPTPPMAGVGRIAEPPPVALLSL